VPACEYNPFEAVQTNVLGTQNVITAARDTGVGRVVVISTDKATGPGNTMGATKLLAERLVSAAHRFSSGQILVAVRFGNVIGSRGSIAPRVLRQLEEEGHAALTHPDMTRFMMTIEDAVSLVLEAGRRAEGGEIFILRMPKLRVRELVEVLVEEYARSVGRVAGDFPIRTIGIRPGEKLHETLVTPEERERTRLVGERLFVVGAPGSTPAPREIQDLCAQMDSASGPFLRRTEILGLLECGRVLDGLGGVGRSSRCPVEAGAEIGIPQDLEVHDTKALVSQ